MTGDYHVSLDPKRKPDGNPVQWEVPGSVVPCRACGANPTLTYYEADKRANAYPAARMHCPKECQSYPVSASATLPLLEAGKQAREKWQRVNEAKESEGGFAAVLAELRERGYSVAVHNDYYIKDSKAWYTFWLFTHSDGHYFKGEGSTDHDALTQVMEQVVARMELRTTVTEALADKLEAGQQEFPVLTQHGHRHVESRGETVPWLWVEQFTKRIKDNHGNQSLTRLAARGGMDWYELDAAMRDIPLTAKPAGLLTFEEHNARCKQLVLQAISEWRARR